MERNKSNEALFRRMAEEYISQYGRELLYEAESLRQSGVEYLTPRADGAIQVTLKKKKQKKARYAAIAAIAACVLMMLMTPTILRIMKIGGQAAESSAIEGDASADFTQEITAPRFMNAANLPEAFSIVSEKEDNGRMIYYISDENLDDVVMTLEYSGNSENWNEGLVKIESGDFSGFAKSEDSYHLLAFEKNNIQYTLTCKYDINTLIAVGKYI